MTTDQPSLEARNLTKDYGHRPVLRRIDLQLASGEVVALMGANGAGKTTLLGCLAAIIRPTAGEVRWFGRPAAAAPADRCRLGMVAHESRLYPHLTLHENLVFAGRMYGASRPVWRAEQWLEEIGLAAHAERLPAEVSRGMRQRVAVARALAHDPQILLLDEPFTGLDHGAAGWLGELLRRLRVAGRAVCFTTHDVSHAAQLADRIWHLRAGRLDEVAPAGGQRFTVDRAALRTA